MESIQPEQILSVVLAAIEALESPHLGSELLKRLIAPPLRERCTFVASKAFWPHSGTAEGDVWLFFTIPSRPSIALAYSDKGYALLGRRWGLIWLEHPHYGDPDCWYESLIDLTNNVVVSASFCRKR